MDDNDSLNVSIYEDDTDIRIIDANIKSKADFMRLILTSQILRVHDIEKEVMKQLKEVKHRMPKLSSVSIEGFRKCFTRR